MLGLDETTPGLAGFIPGEENCSPRLRNISPKSPFELSVGNMIVSRHGNRSGGMQRRLTPMLPWNRHGKVGDHVQPEPEPPEKPPFRTESVAEQLHRGCFVLLTKVGRIELQHPSVDLLRHRLPSARV